MNSNEPNIDELFRIRTTPQRFVQVIKQLHNRGFDFNGVCSQGAYDWPIGKIAVIHGDEAVEALARTGYRFDLDVTTLNFAKSAFHGSVNRAVCLAASRYDRSIEVPDTAEDDYAKIKEMAHPSLRDEEANNPQQSWGFD